MCEERKIVLVDIDGTISKVGERLKHLKKEPPDWDSFYEDCFEDEPILPIVGLVRAIMHEHCGDHSTYEVVFCTGRRESVREKTTIWLQRYFDFGYELSCCDKLLMRKDGDFRHDTEVKPELLIESGIKIEYVAFVIEDRNSMVKKWREMGFVCIQPVEGDF